MKSVASLIPNSAAMSSDGTLPIQSTAIRWPTCVMIGPCTVMSTARFTVAPPRTGIV